MGSETIMGSLGLVEESTTLSFSGLEGLTRSLISTYPCRDRCLNEKTLSFKRGRRIQEAIELVIERELGKVHQQEVLVKAMRDVRNSTAHTDLNSDEPEPQETYYRW